MTTIQKLFKKVKMCDTCAPSCGWWFGIPADLQPHNPLIAGLDVTEGYVILDSELPSPGTPHLAVHPEGTIDVIATESCLVWRRVITRMYSAGYRVLYFSKSIPEESEEYNRQF